MREENTKEETQNRVQFQTKRGRPKSDDAGGPDYKIMAFEEGVESQIGILWTKVPQGKRSFVEIDLKTIPKGVGTLRAWLFPVNQ